MEDEMRAVEMVLEDLRKDEGWRSTLYQDSLGFWTIGYGFLVDPGKKGKMPKEVGEFWLEFEVGRIEEGLIRAFPTFDALPEPVKRGLLNMAYQLGVNGLMGFHTMLARIVEGDYEGASEAALDSKWAHQVPLRARRVANLILKGVEG